VFSYPSVPLTKAAIPELMKNCKQNLPDAVFGLAD
jgi:hypothetical protein